MGRPIGTFLAHTLASTRRFVDRLRAHAAARGFHFSIQSLESAPASIAQPDRRQPFENDHGHSPRTDAIRSKGSHAAQPAIRGTSSARRCRKARGFTLVEVLVVIPIHRRSHLVARPRSSKGPRVGRSHAVSRQPGSNWASAFPPTTVVKRHFPLPGDMWVGMRAPTAKTQTIFMALLPYVEQQDQADAVGGGNQAAAKPVAIFLCPTRRGPSSQREIGLRHP